MSSCRMFDAWVAGSGRSYLNEEQGGAGPAARPPSWAPAGTRPLPSPPVRSPCPPRAGTKFLDGKFPKRFPILLLIINHRQCMKNCAEWRLWEKSVHWSEMKLCSTSCCPAWSCISYTAYLRQWLQLASSTFVSRGIEVKFERYYMWC